MQKLKLLVVGISLATSLAWAEDGVLDTGPTVLQPADVMGQMRNQPAPASKPYAQRQQPPRQRYQVDPSTLTRLPPGQMPVPAGPRPTSTVPAAPEAMVPAADSGIRVETVPREIRQKHKTTSKTLPGLAAGKPIKPLVVEVKPGVTEVIKIARDYPSLIMTPFTEPQVVDGGKVKLVYAGSNVYVMPTGREAEALFISDKAKPGMVVSLMVVPEDLPAQQITLQMEGYKGTAAQELGDQREKKDDYVSSLVDIMREVAQDTPPVGYTESSVDDIEAQMGSLFARPDRRYSGTDRDIFRYQLENRGTTAITVSEQSFYSKGVRAVALFPKIHLAPGESTTLFIMADKMKKEGRQ